MNGPIGVGIVGASPDRGWAKAVHVPALARLPQFALRAVATTRLESAQAAASAFGADLAFDNATALAADPAVDLVVVTVKTAHHHAVVAAALAAGKAVFCEWPLAVDLAEATEMAELAEGTGVRTAVGLQSRLTPAVAYARDLIGEGYLGEVLSTTLVATNDRWGETVDEANAYIADRSMGSTLLSISAGHAIDPLCLALGEFESVSATMANRRTKTRIRETGEVIPMTSEDQVAFTGTLAGGAVVTVHFHGGGGPGPKFLWRVIGTAGELRITSEGSHLGIQGAALEGARNGEAWSALPAPASYEEGVALGTPVAVANLIRLYTRLAADMGGRAPPQSADFATAVQRHRLLDAIERSARSGRRVDL